MMQGVGVVTATPRPILSGYFMEIIIRNKGGYRQWRHRSGAEEALRKEWGVGGVTDEQLDKMKWVEKKSEMNHSSVKQTVIGNVKTE